MNKVSYGDPLEISAAQWNRFVDAADAHDASLRGNRRRWLPGIMAPAIVTIRNSTAIDYDRYDAVRVAAPIILPLEDPNEWAIRPTAEGTTPAGWPDYGRLAVLLEPIAAGETGRGVISGDVQTKVFVNEEWHEFADVDPISGGRRLGSNPDGSSTGQILWKESGIGEVWATVRLSNAGQFHVIGKPIGYGLSAAEESGGILTPGTGTIQLYRLDESAGTLSALLCDDNPCYLDVYNLGAGVGISTWVMPHCDRWGIWWVKELTDVGLFYRGSEMTLGYSIKFIELDQAWITAPSMAGFSVTTGYGQSGNIALVCENAGWYSVSASFNFYLGNGKRLGWGIKIYDQVPSLLADWYVETTHADLQDGSARDRANCHGIFEFSEGDKIQFWAAIKDYYSGSLDTKLNVLSVIIKRWH